MKPIYEPKGKAKEYGDYAINIYTGCPHRCFYCFAPNVLRRDRDEFHSHVEPRPGIVDATRKQIEREKIIGKTIHLCFTCDPYPTGYDASTTREIIKVLKDSGNHIQILTKGSGISDFDLLDQNDWYGITFDGAGVRDMHFVADLSLAHEQGIKTWISFEPVINEERVINFLDCITRKRIVDRVKIGKLNYHPSSIDWKTFGIKIEKICQEIGVDYYIKDSLRMEMQK